MSKNVRVVNDRFCGAKCPYLQREGMLWYCEAFGGGRLSESAFDITSLSVDRKEDRVRRCSAPRSRTMGV